MRKQIKIVIFTMVATMILGASIVAPAQREAEAQSPYVGMGGSARLRYPYNLVINSFREWNHYHEPGTGEPDTLPSHRFWTWGKLDRHPQFPVGECMDGYNNNPDHATIDLIFNCDKPIIDEMVGKYPGAMHQVGNEPNYGPLMTTENYAYQFHLYEEYIHSIDPTAQMLNGGITNVPGWENWTQKFIDDISGYGTPGVDVWVIHPYSYGWIDGVTSAHNSIQFVKDFRTVLTGKGYGNAPIIFGEFSDAGGIQPVAELVVYAETFCDWIVSNKDTYNIIGWYWWGSSSVAMGNAGLFDANRNITRVGEAYIKHCGLYKFKTYLPLIIK